VRVLHIETGRHLYGGARQAGNLIAGLNRAGVGNLLVCLPGHPLAATAAPVSVLPLACAGDHDLGFYRRLRRLIRQQAPDLVHVHSRRGADLWGGRAARAEGVPAVLTRRVESREPAAWLRYKLDPYPAVAAISSAVANELAAAGVPAGRVHRIASAVDTECFRPDPAARGRLLERFELPPEALIAGAAAQLIARKGLASLVPLAARLSAAEPRLRLLLFGRGPEAARLGRLIRAAGLQRQVRLCGFVADWPALLPGLDLLLHPARREGLGSVILEAMSAGVPVVAAAAGGIPDLIEDGVSGRLLALAAADAWQAALLALLRDPPGRQALAAAARQRIAERFTIERMTERYLELYRDVLG
jgi:glycosyltransferase involved in cell wall biosynthesis